MFLIDIIFYIGKYPEKFDSNITKLGERLNKLVTNTDTAGEKLADFATSTSAVSTVLVSSGKIVKNTETTANNLDRLQNELQDIVTTANNEKNKLASTVAEISNEIKQAKLMIPDLKYGSIVSGGIDSTLQTKILSKIKKPDFCLSVFHKDKDKIMKYKKKLFEDRLGLKIKTLNFDKNKYYKNLSKCYQITKSPLFTHDLPSRLFLSREFKKNKCKVFFNADGCDELLGGQQIYLNLFKKVNIFNSNDNHSPYSSIKKKNGVKFLNKFQTRSAKHLGIEHIFMAKLKF